MEAESIPQQTQEEVAAVESADVVVGIVADLDPDSVVALCSGLRTLPGSPRLVVLHRDPAGSGVAASSARVNENGNGSLRLLPWSVLDASATVALFQSLPAACESIFAMGEKLEAKACCVVASRMEVAEPQWICDLIAPLLETECDFAVPYFTPAKLEGLLNAGIIYPLMRSLYGKRIHNPLGPDICVSRRLAQKIVGGNRNSKPGASRAHPLASLLPIAVCNNLSICQVSAGARVYPATNWMNMSSLISQVMAPIFLDMERNAACWQRTRGSVAVPARGAHTSVAHETAELDLNRMVETFQLGVRELQEIWGLILPPSTLFELRKLSRLTVEQLSLPDDLWARIVYDFALAHRLRTVNSDHLLQSMTPLYLAWVVSYARQMATAGAPSVQDRIERLSLAFEAAKPYLVSRWRWPDRFNP